MFSSFSRINTVKSFVLTAIAALGLAVNVNACPHCRMLLYDSIPTNREVIDSARKNADVLLKEYEAVINDTKTFERLKDQVNDWFESVYQVTAYFTKEKNKTIQEVLEDAAAVKVIEALGKKSLDFHRIVDTIFAVNTAPQLNQLLHTFVSVPAAYFKQTSQHGFKYLKEAIARKQLSLDSQRIYAANGAEVFDFNRFKSSVALFEQQKNIIPMIIDLLFDFAIAYKPLLIQLGRALHDLLKDDEFFAEVENDTHDHNQPPKTAAFVKFEEAVKAFVAPIESASKMVAHIKQYSQTNTKTK